MNQNVEKIIIETTKECKYKYFNHIGYILIKGNELIKKSDITDFLSDLETKEPLYVDDFPDDLNNYKTVYDFLNRKISTNMIKKNQTNNLKYIDLIQKETEKWISELGRLNKNQIILAYDESLMKHFRDKFSNKTKKEVLNELKIHTFESTDYNIFVYLTEELYDMDLYMFYDYYIENYI